MLSVWSAQFFWKVTGLALYISGIFAANSEIPVRSSVHFLEHARHRNARRRFIACVFLALTVRV